MNQQIKTIRIFISSTFKDMHSERDYLVKFVFPELKERCIKKGLSLVDVDLRWGVTEEEAEQGKAIEICLDEIENCRPFFIGILGERYGWTPENYQVPEYEKYDWLRKLDKGHSITALEIYHGVLNKKDMKPRAFFYFRKPAFIGYVPLSKQAEVKAESDMASRKLYQLKEDIKDVFTLNNIPGHIMPAYQCTYKGLKLNLLLVKDSLSSVLKKQDISLLEALVGEDNLIDNKEYESLNEPLKRIVDQYSYVYLEGLEEFGNEVLNNVWKAICEEYPDESNITDPLLIEQAYHQRFMNSRTRMFIGREDILGEIADYLNDTSISKPLVVVGEPGSGKSAIMAVAAQRNRDEYNACFNIVRFIGASPASLDINKLVQSIIRETVFNFEIAVDEKRINDVKVLYEYFREVLFKASAKGKLTLFIDAVNQLLPQFDPHYLVWLPKYLPENVKIVISSIESEYTKNALKYEIPFVRVGELTAENSIKIIHDTLEEYRKTLTENQIKTILSKTDAVKPLYLKVSCEELRVFPSFELINSRIARLPDTIDDLFEQFLERLETDHNPKLVKDTLCFIESSMYGLLESELLELLKPADKEKLPVNTWAKLYRNLSPYLMNAGDDNEGLLEFFHLQLSLAVQTRYLVNDAISYYRRLSDYGLMNYSLKNGNTINSVLYTGIYLYKCFEENTLYNLLQSLFTSDIKAYKIYELIAHNLFDWVVNNYDFERETILKSISEKLAKNDFPKQFDSFLDGKATIFLDNGNMLWAMDFFEKSIIVMEELTAKEPNMKDYVQILSLKYLNNGHICKLYGEDGRTLKLFEKSLMLMEDLVVLEPTMTDYKLGLSGRFEVIGNEYESLGETERAHEFYDKSLKIVNELVALEPTRKDLRMALSNVLSSLGNSYDIRKEPKKKLDFFEKSLKEIEKVLSFEPSSSDYKFALSQQFVNLGIYYSSLAKCEESLIFFEKSLKQLEELVAQEPLETNFVLYLSLSLIYTGSENLSKGDREKANEYFNQSIKVWENLIINYPERTDFKKHLYLSLYDVGILYKIKGEGQKALTFFKKSLKVMEELVTLEPYRADFRFDYANSNWNIYQVCPEEEKIKWRKKTKDILDPMVKNGIPHAKLMQLWEIVNHEENINKRSQALVYYQSGDYKKARQLLEDLLHDKFEVVSTRMHLARLALITDNLEEAAQHIHEVWNIQNEAKNYVVARILWVKLTLAFLNNSSPENYFSQLKAVLQREDAIMSWTMQPVLDHIKPKLTKQQHALLSALVDSMSDKQNLEKLLTLFPD